MPLARSTRPFVCGCATADQSTRMWKLSQNVKNFLPVNWVLLSVMIEFGTPNLKIIVGAYQRHLEMTPADDNLGRQYFMNHE